MMEQGGPGREPRGACYQRLFLFHFHISLNFFNYFYLTQALAGGYRRGFL